MKRSLILLVILFLAFLAKGQNVGVGIAAPNDVFHVYDASGTSGILFNNVTTGSTLTNGLRITIDGSSNVLFNQQQSAEMQFLTASAVRMHIDKNGFVSINSVPVTGAQLLVSTSTVNYAGLVGVGNNGSSVLPGSTGFGVLGSVGIGNPNVGVGGFYGGNVDIGSGGAGVFGSSKGTSGISYGVYGTSTGTATNIAGYFTAAGGANNYGIIVPSGNVGIGTISPNSSSILDMSAITTKGMLIPQVALASALDNTTILTPAASLLVYNTGSGGLSPAGYYYNSGTSGSPSWVQLLTSSPAVSGAWLTTGNAGTIPGVLAGQNFLGTTGATDFIIATNTTERMRVASNGLIGINTSPSASNNFEVLTATSSISPFGAALVGIDSASVLPTTFKGKVGVFGMSGVGTGSAGVLGYITGKVVANYKPKIISGVFGESAYQQDAGVVGINSASPSATGSNTGYGVYGSTRQAQSPAIFGTNPFAGIGVEGISSVDSNSSATIFGIGVEGLSNGNGVIGITQGTGSAAVGYSGVYGQYAPAPAANGVGGVAAVLGFNQNTVSSNGNIGVEGYYYNGGVLPFGIGVYGFGNGGGSVSPTTLTGDFGVVGSVGGSRTTSAGVAGFVGNPAFNVSGALASVAAAVYGASAVNGDYALYAVNTFGVTGNGLFVKGTTNLQGIATLGNTTKTNGALVFDNSTNNFNIKVITGVTSPASYILTLPTSQGSVNSFLTNAGDINGTLSWTNASALVTTLNGISSTVAPLTNVETILLGGPLTQSTTITLGNFDYINNLNGTGNFHIQKAGTDAFDVFNSGQVAINQSTVPNANLQAVTNGYTYSSNQITSIPLYAGYSGPPQESSTSSTQFPFCQAGFNPTTFRPDGDVQIQVVVYYTTTAVVNNFQLDANNGHPDSYVFPVTSAPAWTYASVGGGVTVVTSPWTEWKAGTNAYQIHLEGYTDGSGTISVYNAYVLVRAMNN